MRPKGSAIELSQDKPLTSLTLIMFTFSSCIVGYIVCSKSVIKILNSCNEYCAKYVQSLQQKPPEQH